MLAIPMLWRSFTRTTSRSYSVTRILRQAADMETVNTTERLQRLRELMKSNQVDIYSMHSCCHRA